VCVFFFQHQFVHELLEHYHFRNRLCHDKNKVAFKWDTVSDA
jgi:hypothetical protein